MMHEHAYESPRRWTAAFRKISPAIFCGAAGFLSAFTVSLVGQMPVGEIVLLIVFPFVILQTLARHGWPGRLQTMGWFKLLLLLSALMMIGYVSSDLYRGTSTSNIARGWARVAFLAVDLVAIAYLVNVSWHRLHILAICLYLGFAANAAVNGPLYGDWWQFGVGYTITFVIAYLIAGRGVGIQVAALIALGFTSLALGARSLGGICLLASGLFGLRYAKGIFRPAAVLLSFGAIALLFWVANNAFIDTQNHRGSNTERQSMIEAASESFIKSPLIGQGSWFTTGHFLERLEDKRKLIDPSFRGYSAEEASVLSIHSQLLVALAEGGLLGGAFFIGMFALLMKTIRALTRDSSPHRAFAMLVVISALWNLFMSPFSGVARVEIVIAICVCLLVILQRQGELEESFRE